MKNCKQLLILLNSRPQEGMKQMYLDEEFRKIAKIKYNQFPTIKSICTWEDIFLEGIKRFVLQVKAKKGIVHCKAYFNGICRLYCLELNRLSRKPEGSLENGKLDKLYLAIQPYIQQLGAQCQLLLILLFFYNPPYDPKNRKELVEILKEYGYDVSESSISTIISRCKTNLKKIIGNKLDDFDELYNF